jgi:hypothetical protein
MHNFTPEDLVQYLYNETSTEKTAAIKAAIETDYSLREEFEVLTSDQKRLQALRLSPRKEAINKILNYAEKAMGELHSH